MVELVQAGVLDMAKISANTLGQFDDRYTIFSLPYLFNGQEHYYNAMANSQVIRELFNATEDAGYIAIGYYCNGARNFYLKDDVAVTSPAVLKGKKIRSMVSSTSMDMIEAMGGSPVPMSASETYTSLQQGIVDGAENTELALTVTSMRRSSSPTPTPSISTPLTFTSSARRSGTSSPRSSRTICWNASAS